MESEPSKSIQGTQGGPKDLDDHLAGLDSIPLFMKSLPDAGENDTTAIDALQSLTFDGTPDEVASGFKKQGNDYYVGKRYKEARGFYTQALDAYPTDVSLKESLLTNRAACNLALENYGMALRDCSEALGLNPRSSKAFYRSAKGLFALDRFIEAIDCCDHALLIDETNQEVVKLRSAIVEKSQRFEKLKAEAKERERRAKETKTSLDRAYVARGLWVQTTPRPPENPNPPHFDPNALPELSRSSLPLLNTNWKAPDPIRTPLVFPVLFLYPQHQQSDLVSHFHEDETVGDQLDAMFPLESKGSLPWDASGEYVSKNLHVYVVTHAKRLLRLGRKLSLREVLDHGAREADASKGQDRDGVILQDGILSLIVLPRGPAESEWVTRFKNERETSSLNT